MQDEQIPPVTKKPQPLSHKLTWVAMMVFVVGLIVAAIIQQVERRSSVPPPPVHNALPPFSLTDETSSTVTLDTFKGKLWVVDFIFTRCGGQCPFMSSRMRTLQQWLEKEEFDDVMLVSITVDPENDTPEIFAEYGPRFAADPDRWKFLTGERAKIYELIREGFKIGVEENKDPSPGEEEFIHSNRFVLIDREGNIRGWYVADEEEAMEKLRDEITALKKAP